MAEISQDALNALGRAVIERDEARAENRALRARAEAAEAEWVRQIRMRDAYFESSRQEQRRAEAAEDRLAEVEDRLRTASVLEIAFKLRDELLAAARGEGDR